MVFAILIPREAYAVSSVMDNIMRVSEEKNDCYEGHCKHKNNHDERKKGIKLLSRKAKTQTGETIEIASVENLDPNNAYIIEHENIIQGNLVATDEMRWYAFFVNDTSKMTIYLQSVDAVDVDVYLFRLNPETYQLEYVAVSAADGFGRYELFSQIVDSGTYFVAVNAYKGNGQYAFAFYLTSDIVNEINDNPENATTTELNGVVCGRIDSPYDFDYFEFEVLSPVLIELELNTGNLKCEVVSKNNDSVCSKIDGFPTYYRCNAGKYCLKIWSEDGTYNPEYEYSVKINKVGDISGDLGSSYFMINKEVGAVFQTDYAGRHVYVNGHFININYEYHVNESNSAGQQKYDISMTTPTDLRAKIYVDQFKPSDVNLAVQLGMEMPDVVYYIEGTKGMGFNHIPVLAVSFYSPEVFYHIHCKCTGAYAANNMVNDINYVTVFIDLKTGVLVDILHLNYFYEYATGSSKVLFTRPYSSKTVYLYKYSMTPEGVEKGPN